MTTDETLTPTAHVEPEASAPAADQASDNSMMATPSDHDASAQSAPEPEPVAAPKKEPAKPKMDDSMLFEAAMREMDS